MSGLQFQLTGSVTASSFLVYFDLSNSMVSSLRNCLLSSARSSPSLSCDKFFNADVVTTSVPKIRFTPLQIVRD